MTLFNHVKAVATGTPDGALDVLAEAAKGRLIDAGSRVFATPDSYDPTEGLALLEAYVGIADVAVRQAVLDIVMTLAATDPYRRVRSSAREGGRRMPSRPFEQDR